MIDMLTGDLTPEWYNNAVQARIVGMDIETSGLSKITDKIATIQLYVPSVGTVMVRKMDRPLYICQLLENRYVGKIFHHAPFDLGFLIRDYNIWPQYILDTKIAAKILDPKRTRFIHPTTGKGSHSLETLVAFYFDYRMNKQLAVSDWFADNLSQEQLEYAAKDVEYLPELYASLTIALARENKLKLAQSAMEHLTTHVMLELKNYTDVYGY